MDGVPGLSSRRNLSADVTEASAAGDGEESSTDYTDDTDKGFDRGGQPCPTSTRRNPSGRESWLPENATIGGDGSDANREQRRAANFKMGTRLAHRTAPRDPGCMDRRDALFTFDFAQNDLGIPVASRRHTDRVTSGQHESDMLTLRLRNRARNARHADPSKRPPRSQLKSA